MHLHQTWSGMSWQWMKLQSSLNLHRCGSQLTKEHEAQMSAIEVILNDIMPEQTYATCPNSCSDRLWKTSTRWIVWKEISILHWLSQTVRQYANFTMNLWQELGLRSDQVESGCEHNLYSPFSCLNTADVTVLKENVPVNSSSSFNIWSSLLHVICAVTSEEHLIKAPALIGW